MLPVFCYLADVLDDHTAVRLSANGVGGDAVGILQGCVDHMALVGIHRLQGGAAVCLQYLLCLLLCVAAQGFLTLFAVGLSIHIDADVTLDTPVYGVVCQMLDGIQSVATAADQVTQILANQLYQIGVVLTLDGVGNSLGAHVLQQTLDELLDLLFHIHGSPRHQQRRTAIWYAAAYRLLPQQN